MPPLFIGSEEYLKPFMLEAAIDPVSQGAGTVTSGWMNAADFAGIVAIISTGVLGAGATVNAKLQQAQDVGGTGAKDIVGKAITPLTQAGGGSGKQAVIICQRMQIDIGSGFPYVRVSLTVAVAASQIAASLFGVNTTYGSQRPQPLAASVAEIVR